MAEIELASKAYVDDKVKTDVPAGAKFTDNDTVTRVNGNTGDITKEDIIALGIAEKDTVVDISKKADKTYVDNKVKTDVPAGAKFTDNDTKYKAGTGLNLSGTTFSVDWSQIPDGEYDGTNSGLEATTIHGAIDELKALIDGLSV